MNVDAYVWGALSFLFEELQHRVLRVVARIFRERLGNREQRLGIRLHAKLGTPRHLSLVLDQVGVRKRLEAARAGDERAVGESVCHGARAVAHRFLDLRDDVLVRALDENSARERVLDTLDERVHLLAERLLVDRLGPAKNLGGKRLERVDLLAAAREADALHIASLRAAQRKDALAREHVERERID